MNEILSLVATQKFAQRKRGNEESGRGEGVREREDIESGEDCG